MGSPQVPFDPTGNPFPKQPPSSGERPDEPKGDDGPLPEKNEEELS